MSGWLVRPVRGEEFEPWARLFMGYADFYRWTSTAEHQRTIWRWIQVERRMEALVAVRVDLAGVEIGEPEGLAHLREWVRPLRGTVNGYLDDLFVDPLVCGAGAVDALFAEINRIAVERGWAVVRWTTAEDNHRAQAVYDRVASRTSWVTYDLTPRS